MSGKKQEDVGVEIFINEENDILLADDQGEVNISAAILGWLDQGVEDADPVQVVDDLVLVKEAAYKLLRAAEARLKQKGSGA